MIGSLFPPHIRTIDEALGFLPLWAESFGGVLRDGIVSVDRASPAGNKVFADVEEFRIDFPHADTVLTTAAAFGLDLRASSYKFDLRRADGTLLWREDNHPGHEVEHGGSCHLHIGPGENHRVASAPRTLLDIAEKVITTHISRI